MTQTRKDIYHSQTAEDQFLFYQTDIEQEDSGEESRRDFHPTILKEIFPDLVSKNEFRKSALDILTGKKRFSVIAVRIDDITSTGDDEETDGQMNSALVKTAEAVDSVCKAPGSWCQIGERTLICFFPEKNEAAALTYAGNIKNEILKTSSHTVTAGVADYPKASFSHEQIFANAVKALDHAFFFGPDSLTVFDDVSLNISGDKFYQQGDIDSAIREFTCALAINPENANVHNSIGVCFAVQKKYDNALNAFEKAVSIDPDEVMAVYNTGLVHMLNKEKDKALEYFLKASGIDSETFEIIFQTGRTYLEIDKPEDALTFLLKAAELKPDSGTVLRFAGDAYTALGRIDDAVTAYKNAVKKSPSDASALSALGSLFDDMNRNTDIALLFCKQSVEIAPGEGLFRFRLGRLYLKKEMDEAALEEFKAASSLGYDAEEHISMVQQKLAVNES